MSVTHEPPPPTESTPGAPRPAGRHGGRGREGDLPRPQRRDDRARVRRHQDATGCSDLPLRNGRADESGNVGETGDLKPGTTKSVSLNLAAGHYALICNLPGHYVAGQHTDFSVR